MVVVVGMVVVMVVVVVAVMVVIVVVTIANMTADIRPPACVFGSFSSEQIQSPRTTDTPSRLCRNTYTKAPQYEVRHKLP